MPGSDSKSVKAPSPIWVLVGLIALELLFVLPSQGLPMGTATPLALGFENGLRRPGLALRYALVLFWSGGAIAWDGL